MNSNHQQVVRVNSKEVIIPWFVIGAAEPDLQAIWEALTKNGRRR